MNEFNNSNVHDKLIASAGVFDVSIRTLQDQVAVLFRIIKDQEVELERLRVAAGVLI